LSGGTLEIVLDTAAYPSVFSSTLNVSGSAILDGALFVDLTSPQEPDAGSLFTVLQYSDRTNTFVLIADDSPNRTFAPDYQPTSLVLITAPGGAT
jgi:hypothetical protein